MIFRKLCFFIMQLNDYDLNKRSNYFSSLGPLAIGHNINGNCCFFFENCVFLFENFLKKLFEKTQVG